MMRFYYFCCCLCYRQRCGLLLALLLICFFSGIGSTGFAKNSNKYNVAVCISGQLGRLLPESTLPHLIHANSQHFHFTFFLNLQYSVQNSSSSIFATDPHITFQPSKYTFMKQNGLLQSLHDLYEIPEISSLGSIIFVPPRSLSEWETDVFRGEKADRITQYADMQHVILNFHEHQVRCSHQLQEYEELYNRSFDYIISTREDVMYFSFVNLTFLTKLLKENHHKQIATTVDQVNVTMVSSSSTDKQQVLTGESIAPNQKCEFLSKECLAWQGINMRWQLMTRDVTSRVLGNRLHFYHYLISERKTCHNPEQFELAQLIHYGIQICDVLGEVIPNIVGRHVSDDNVCFLKPETIDNCVPKANLSYVHQNLCHHVNKKLRISGNP
jgi:hypothetical protein